MSVRYLLDTNIISHMIREPSGSVQQKIAAIGNAQVLTSVVVAAELRFGAVKKGSHALGGRIETALSRLQVASLEPPADKEYAQVRAKLEGQGRSIGSNDLLIAAHALALDCTLVTDNTGEFSRVQGLRVENWLR